jgi:predicted Rossmann-fold nucleotide-binding protein
MESGLRALIPAVVVPRCGPCITVFGSARYDESHECYALGREVGRGVAELGFTAMTGGGPGLMEAVNRSTISSSARFSCSSTR